MIFLLENLGDSDSNILLKTPHKAHSVEGHPKFCTLNALSCHALSMRIVFGKGVCLMLLLHRIYQASQKNVH